jgi:hypothetical protein
MTSFGPNSGKAVGGFIEAIMTIVIVTCGLTLLTISFDVLSIEQEETSDLGTVCEELMDGLLERSQNPSILDRALLDDLPPLQHECVTGYTIMITMSPEGSIFILGSGGEEYLEGERHLSRRAVNIVNSPRDVDAAVLTLWVW